MWYVMAAGVPMEVPGGTTTGTQMIAVDAPSKRDAINHAIGEIRKKYNLPKNYTIMPRILVDYETEEEAAHFLELVAKKIEEEESNAEA